MDTKTLDSPRLKGRGVLQESDSSRAWLMALTQAGGAFAKSPDPREALARVVQIVVSTVAQGCRIELVEAGKLAIAAAAGLAPPPDDPREAAQILGSAQSLLQEETGAPGVRSRIRVPLAAARGLVVGVLTLVTGAGERRLQTDDLDAAEELGRRCALALEQARLEAGALETVQKRDRLLSVVAHDLRGPLGVIELNTALFTRKVAGTPAEPGVAKHVLGIRGAVARISRILDTLADVAAIEAGRVALGFGHEPIDRLVEDALGTVVLHPREQSHALVADIAPGLPPVRCDRARIVRVLEDLLTNAVRVGPDSGKVVVRARLVAGEVVVSVVDSSVALDEEALACAFEVGSPAAASRGPSLGLHLARPVVEAHGGRLWAEADASGGCALSFTLPVAVSQGNSRAA